MREREAWVSTDPGNNLPCKASTINCRLWLGMSPYSYVVSSWLIVVVSVILFFQNKTASLAFWARGMLFGLLKNDGNYNTYGVKCQQTFIKICQINMVAKIAVVEDETPIAHMYQLKLQHDGYEVRTATNGLEGLELCQHFLPALLLLDLRMPVMDGSEMLEKLRTTDWGSNIRVIILTNISRDEAPSRLRFLDVDRYIVKAHHTPAQVVKIVEEVLDIKPHAA